MREKSSSSLREKLRRMMSEPGLEDLASGLEALIAELVERYHPRSIIIAGSVAKSRFVRGLSDIDLLVITDVAPSKSDRFVLTAIKDVNVEVTVYSLEEVVNNIRGKNLFVIDAIERGFEVYGDAIATLRRVLHEARAVEDY